MGEFFRHKNDDGDESALREATRRLFLAEARVDALERSAEYQLACRTRQLLEFVIPPSGRLGTLHRAIRKTLEIWLNEGFGMLWARAVSRISREARRRFRREHDSSRNALHPAQVWNSGEVRRITRLNLIYHVTPMQHPDRVWQWNVAELLKRIHHFNGRRIITVVTSSEGRAMDPPEVVAAAFAGHDVELRFAPNDPILREARHFIPALREIASTDPTEALFYAHAKGVSHLDQTIVRPWTSAMYCHNLDRIDEVRELLGRWPCVGIAKRRGDFVRLSYGQPRSSGSLRRRKWNGWHYSGTFWWARHDSLFSRPDWDQIPQHAFAVEGYLANFFRPDEAVCLAYEDIPDPYNPAIWQDAAA